MHASESCPIHRAESSARAADRDREGGAPLKSRGGRPCAIVRERQSIRRSARARRRKREAQTGAPRLSAAPPAADRARSRCSARSASTRGVGATSPSSSTAAASWITSISCRSQGGGMVPRGFLGQGSLSLTQASMTTSTPSMRCEETISSTVSLRGPSSAAPPASATPPLAAGGGAVDALDTATGGTGGTFGAAGAPGEHDRERCRGSPARSRQPARRQALSPGSLRGRSARVPIRMIRIGRGHGRSALAAERHTLNRKCATSPSLKTYARPSTRSLPALRMALSVRWVTRSSTP